MLWISSEFLCLLAIIFTLIAIPLTGILATIFGSVSILCIGVIFCQIMLEDDDEDF